MKKIMMLTALLCASFMAYSQTSEEPKIPFIEVIGSAEMEVEPDEIRLSVIIGNYVGAKKVRDNISLDEADRKLRSILSEVGVKDNQIILKDAATNNYWVYYWQTQKHMDEARVEKKYEIILTTTGQLDRLLNLIPGPKEGFIKVNIAELKNKDITEYRKQVKIRAIKSAKAKAEYLLESIGSKVGRPLYVLEMEEQNLMQPQNLMQLQNLQFNEYSLQRNALMNGEYGDYDTDTAQMQKIKLAYKIKARFEVL